MKKDYLIVGQGLAGSFLAWNLLQRGKSLTIVDQNHAQCSSFAAAGMINPVTGKRLVLSERCEELLPHAKTIYLQLEQQFGTKFFESKDIIRLFNNDQERMEWEKKSRQTPLKKYYGKRQPAGSCGRAIDDSNGSFMIHQGGYCRTHALMKCFTEYFAREGCLVHERFCYDDLKIAGDHVQWKGDSFARVVFCEGFQAQDNPWFSWLPFNHAKGEILTLANQGDGLPDAVISFGKWCIPIGDGQYTVGSTYAWDKFDCVPTETGRKEILESIKAFIKVSFDVVEHCAGVRPIMKDLKPAMGVHPKYSCLTIFNGLASKGLLWGPFYSQQMSEFLTRGEPLESGVDIARF